MEEERLSNVCSLSCQATPWSASSNLPHLSQGSPGNLGRRHDEEDNGLKDRDDCDEDNDGELDHLKDDLIHFDDIAILNSSVLGRAEFSKHVTKRKL